MKEIILTTKNYEGRYLELVCRQLPNPEENTSELRWTLSVKGGAVSWYSTGPTTVRIGGQQVYFCKRRSFETKTFPAAKGSVSGSLVVPHDEEGRCTLEVELETAIYTATLSKVTESWQLEDILRASRIRAADASIGSCATVVIGRGSSNFTHTVFYQFGEQWGWLDALGDPVTQPVRHGETTLNFLLPESFYEEIPDRPRDSCQLICTTYLDDRVLGESSCSFTVTADPALCAPSVEAAVFPVDELTLFLDDRPLPGISTLCCRVSAAAQKGATVVSVTAGEETVAAEEVQLPGWSLPTVPVEAVDSRGYRTRLEVPCNFLPYVPPVNLSAVARPAPTADCAQLTVRGSAYMGGFRQTENWVEAVVEFDGRQLTVPLYPEGNGSFSESVVLEGLSYTRSYPVTVTVRDLAARAVTQLTVQKGIPVFDWGEEDFRFHVPVEVPALTVNGQSLPAYLQSLIQNQ